jgi:hypothetical protein
VASGKAFIRLGRQTPQKMSVIYLGPSFINRKQKAASILRLEGRWRTNILMKITDKFAKQHFF